MATYNYQEGDPGQWISNAAGEPVGMTDAKGRNHFFARLGENILTVGSDGAFKTVAAALNWIGNQPCFIARTDLTATATAWVQGTSTITLSASPTVANYDPSTRMWFKLVGDTYYYPVDSSSNMAISGTLYSAMNRIETNLTGTPAVTFYEEQNYTILILDPWIKESVNVAALAAQMSVTITSLGGSVLDLSTTGTQTWLNGRLKFHNVILHHNGQGGLCSAAPNFNTLKLEIVHAQIDSAQADFYSPYSYFGSVDVEFCRVNSFYNSTRGHMLNFLTKGDQRFKNITWNVKNNASIGNAVLSDAYFVDRFYARNMFLENVRGNIADPHGDFGKATLVGPGSGATGIGTAAQADYISIQDCNLVMRDAATATMLINILSLADGSGIQLGATTAGASGGVVDIHNSGIIAPRGTSTRKLVQALANPTNAIVVNVGVNPFAQAKDAQANITYPAIS